MAILMFEEGEEDRKIFIYSPMSILYFVFLLFITTFMFPYLILAGKLISYALGIPSYITLLVFMLSLLGSQLNIKIKEAKSPQPILIFKEISFFGIYWRIPDFRYGVKKTVIAVNVGGALIPMMLSLYLLLYSVPMFEQNPTVTYLKIAIAFTVVTLVVHAFAKPIKGLGIAVPSFIPPLTAALTSAILFSIYAESNPFIIAYVSGTFGTLVGADLLNLHKISDLGAPIISIGGAGVFDGIYITGIMAIFLLWLII
jgi:uncharacterized membrane protein